MMSPPTNLLARILESKRAEVSTLVDKPSTALHHDPGGLVFQTLRRLPGQPLRLIAEIKPRSPSAGSLSNVLTVTQRADVYAKSGAVMISVLVDKPFFGGSYDNLAACRETLDATYGASRPRLLCKEFILDEVQIEWAARAGADAVLLIAKIVTEEKLQSLIEHARMRGLESLVEVTTDVELQMAASAGAQIIGVNARDLNTLVMDQARAAQVLAMINTRCIRVHLSGLVLPDDVARIARVTRAPADAALVGEALMRQDDPTELLSEMVRRAADKP